jgi:dual specificity protein kinase YAK1
MPRTFADQARIEISILHLLNGTASADEESHIVKLSDSFSHCRHLCLVFELLHMNLYELLKQNQFRGLSTSLLRLFLGQLLQSLQALRRAGIIHCDIKPENVLLVSLHSGQVKLIDFGSACADGRTVYSYIQSRFYRAPEVVLGCSYGPAIDMWSLGAVAAELFLGLPIFPGASEFNLLQRIGDALGPVPDSVLTAGKNTSKFFRSGAPPGGADGLRSWQMLTQAEHEAKTGKAAALGKRYFAGTTLHDIIHGAPLRKGLSDAELARERLSRDAFVDWLQGVLALDPVHRWTPTQAAAHPFITGAPFDPSQRWTPPTPPVPFTAPQSPQQLVSAFHHVGSPVPSPRSVGTMAMAWPGGGLPVGVPHSPQSFSGMMMAGQQHQMTSLYGTPPGGFHHSPHAHLLGSAQQHAATHHMHWMAHAAAQQQAAAAAMFGVSPPGMAWPHSPAAQAAAAAAAAAGATGWHAPSSVGGAFSGFHPPPQQHSMQRRSSTGMRELSRVTPLADGRSPRVRQQQHLRQAGAQRRRLSEGGASLRDGSEGADTSPLAPRVSQGQASRDMDSSPSAADWDPAFSDDSLMHVDEPTQNEAMAAHVAALAHAHAQAHVMQLAQLQLHQAHAAATAAAVAQGWGVGGPVLFGSSPGSGAFGHPLGQQPATQPPPTDWGPEQQQQQWTHR